MAPKNGKESLLELCTRATVLGNSIAVRMFEYLSIAKSHPQSFGPLAVEFLEISRLLWPIEAGLRETSRTHTQMPADIIQELDKKFRQTNDSFIVLNQMLIKFIEYENKGGLARLQKGWRMMFAEGDIDKMRESLSQSREALRMSALAFSWSQGRPNSDASGGIGYTGLAAALERMNQSRPTSYIHPLQNPASVPPELPPSPPLTLPAGRTSPSNSHRRREDTLRTLSEILDRQSVGDEPSISSIKHTTTPTAREQYMHTDGSLPAIPADNVSEITSLTQIEDMIKDVEFNDNYSGKVVRIKADPTTVPRWTPKQTSGVNSAASMVALVNAVEQKKHKMVEQLLDCGVPANSGTEVNLLRVAILNQDIESVRLLLLFGAEPDDSDRAGLTPLFSATVVSFLEGAKMLMKYGADPNLSAGPDAESCLAKAITENRAEFVQLYLKYGGDADSIMANGNTAFIKAMNKSSPVKLVELMLKYGSDPNAKNGEGKTPLFEAIQAGRIDLMTLLLDHRADPNLPGPKHLLWPSTYQPKALQLLLSRGADHEKCSGIMELATSINNIESVSILLNAGVNPNNRKDGTYTPLCTAIRDNREDIVSLLLANGADPNFMASEYPAFKCVTHNRAQFLPQLVAAGSDLHKPKGIIEKAVAHNNKAALMYLLEQGVSPNDRSAEGHTPLTTAIRDDRSDFVDVLLANGADPSVRGEEWPVCMAVKRPIILKKLLPAIRNLRSVKGVMEMAVVANQLESIKLLLLAGISVEDKNGGVFSPLTTAIREDNKEIVRFLLDEAGADVNTPGEHLPIIKAIRRCRGDDMEIIEMLLERGADINLMYRGWNAVLQAAENGDAKVLRLLAEKGGGIDMQATDESGRTVMEIVKELGWDEAASILLGIGDAGRTKLTTAAHQ